MKDRAELAAWVEREVLADAAYVREVQWMAEWEHDLKRMDLLLKFEDWLGKRQEYETSLMCEREHREYMDSVKGKDGIATEGAAD